MNKIKLLLAALLLLGLNAGAQQADSLLNRLDQTKLSGLTEAVFKSTRVVLTQSSETEKKHDLDLQIRHRFGDIGGQFGGSHTLFGLDGASDIFIGLDYGVSDRLTVGAGRSRQNELYDFDSKYKLLQQKTDNSMPINLTLFGQMGWITRKSSFTDEFSDYSDRLSYYFQAIFSRKFSSSLSLQVVPGYLLRSNSADVRDPDNLFTMGFAGRIKLTKRLSFVADYTIVNGLSRPKDLAQAYYNPLGVGLEIETGGHVFSLDFMNSEYISENNFIPNTKASWRKGGVRFGFTISRNFTLFKSKNKDKEQETKIY